MLLLIEWFKRFIVLKLMGIVDKLCDEDLRTMRRRRARLCSKNVGPEEVVIWSLRQYSLSVFTGLRLEIVLLRQTILSLLLRSVDEVLFAFIYRYMYNVLN